MRVITTVADMQSFSAVEHAAGRSIGFVPTMGALHAGHSELIRDAARRCDTVVVSVFVNPTQFNVASDFDSYPRTLDADLDVAAAAGATAVYAPVASAMYGEDHDTIVRVGRTAAPLEGAGRPGHFDGVATVVTKLFNAVRPDIAVFGAKDYQQLAVVSRMTADLDFGIEIVAHPTVREGDGLALSSRNARLQPLQRAAAPVIHRALREVLAAHTAGTRASSELLSIFRRAIAEEPLARLEYVAVSDTDSLADIQGDVVSAVVSCAVWFGDVRLIDNILLP